MSGELVTKEVPMNTASTTRVLEAQIREIGPSNFKWRVFTLRPSPPSKDLIGVVFTKGRAKTYKQACAAAGEAMNACRDQVPS